jgi:hypothetical protein
MSLFIVYPPLIYSTLIIILVFNLCLIVFLYLAINFISFHKFHFLLPGLTLSSLSCLLFSPPQHLPMQSHLLFFTQRICTLVPGCSTFLLLHSKHYSPTLSLSVRSTCMATLPSQWFRAPARLHAYHSHGAVVSRARKTTRIEYIETTAYGV